MEYCFGFVMLQGNCYKEVWVEGVALDGSTANVNCSRVDHLKQFKNNVRHNIERFKII